VSALLLTAALLAQLPEQLVSAGAPEEARPYKIGANVEYRGLAVWDETRRNDQAFNYRLKGRYYLPKDLLPVPLDVRLGLGLNQRFVAEGEESGFRLHDTSFFLHTSHDLDLLQLGLPRPIEWQHFLGVYAPTSRTSYNNSLIVAPMARTQGRYEVLPQIYVGLDASFQYLWYQYAEAAGIDGGMNSQLVFGGGPVVEASLPLPQPLFGELVVSGDVWTEYDKHYGSRESYETDVSSQAAWFQSYGWDVSVGWSPTAWLFAAVGVEQNSRVLRDGIINPQFAHRDETEFTLVVEAWY
jgi:hypothetical protein